MLLAALLVLGAAVVADRLGVFGRPTAIDWERYHDKTFLVARVIDGDTLDIDVPDGNSAHTRVRLWGVDTPEVHGRLDHFGRQASQRAKELAAGQTVRIELEPHRTRCSYGRLLAMVHLPDGRLLNAVLVEEGYAYADPRFEHSRKRHFDRLQRRAITQGAGLWAEVTNDDLPPYYRDRLPLPPQPTPVNRP